ncbi:asparaginase [Halovulum dunhuangense]|uniref:Asparaginase n=1 Tax=Halovulum dunhuangense TaxID=1505036 RepID=A0A849KZ14_9RHOB|nr:asparaginase [Halovulum dunhuangense]NNU79142.1 asparaginase [Halovulum dunhuangense]
MTEPVVLAELWRGDFLEGVHRGHAVIVDETGGIVAAWGDPKALIYPRSSSKMLQALPLVESGAADRAGLGSEELALACASHKGAHVHTERVARWLGSLGLSEADLRCGPQVPDDAEARHALRDAGRVPCQIHNNCSGKHAGFLTLARELGGGTEYIDADHPVQRAARAATEEMAGEESPGFGIDGCSAPNFVLSLHGFGRAMARMAATDTLAPRRADAARRLVAAMAAHPVLIGGTGSASTEITAAAEGRAVIKTGAEGVFGAILPEARLGIALKVEDGATRASDAAIAALLVRLGILPREHPAIASRIEAIQHNRRGVAAARIVAAEALF